MTEEKKMGVEALLKVADGLEAVGVPVAKSLADGKVNAEDLPNLLDLVKSHQKIIDAVSALDEVVPEAKDIDAAEAVLVVQKLWSVGNAIKAAAKSPSSTTKA